MRPLQSFRFLLVLVVFALAVLAGTQACRVENESPQPISYTMRFPAPEIQLMMPLWSPGFYRIQDYAAKIEEISARTPEGAALSLEAEGSNRWRVLNGGGDLHHRGGRNRPPT